MGTPNDNRRRPVEIAGHLTIADRIAQDGTAMLIYLYDYQRRLDWLASDMATLSHQVAALQGIQAQPGTIGRVRAAIESSVANSQANLQAMTDLQRESLTFHGQIAANLHTLGFLPPEGAPNWANVSATDIGRRIVERTGGPIQAAVNALPAEFPMPPFQRPPHMPVIVRNNRLIRRYGGQSDCPDADSPALVGATAVSGTCNIGPPGASAEPLGFPDGLQSAESTYYASWATQARLFSVAIPIKGDLNHRRWTFRDGSYVEFQASRAQLTVSDDSKASAAGLIIGNALAGAIVAGPVGAVVAAAAAGAAYRLTRPDDAAWQGYSVQYFQSKPAAKGPWGTANFYGWKRAPTITQAVQFHGNGDPKMFPHFADQPQGITWWRLQRKDFRAAAPALETPAAGWTRDIHQLINAMGGFSPSPAVSGPSPREHGSYRDSGSAFGLSVGRPLYRE